jgi:hypothetical protein
MAGVKARGIISVQHIRTHERDGEQIEVKPVKYYGPGSNGRTCGAFKDTGEMVRDSNGNPKSFKSI